MLNWSYVETDTSKTLFIIDDEGITTTVSDSHPNFVNIRAVLDKSRNKPVEGKAENYVKRFLDPTTYFLGDRLKVEEDTIKLDGEVISPHRLNILLSLDTMIEENPDTRNRKNIPNGHSTN